MRKLSRRGRFKATVKYAADAAPRVKPKLIFKEETSNQAPVPNPGTFHVITLQPQDWNDLQQTILQEQDFDTENSGRLDSPRETNQIPQVVKMEEEDSHENSGPTSDGFVACYKPSEGSVDYLVASENALDLLQDSEVGRTEYPVLYGADITSQQTEEGSVE